MLDIINIADLIIVAILVFSAILGYKNGLVRSVFNLGYHLIALIIAAVSYPFITDMLTKTRLYTWIYDIAFKKAAEGNFINTGSLPEFLRAPVESGVNAAAQNAAATVTDLVVTILSILIVFVAVKLVLSLVAKSLNFVARLPVIKSFNKLGGLLFGLLSGAVIVYVLLALLTIFPDSQFTTLVNAGELSRQMYNSNLVLQFMFN